MLVKELVRVRKIRFTGLIRLALFLENNQRFNMRRICTAQNYIAVMQVRVDQ